MAGGFDASEQGSFYHKECGLIAWIPIFFWPQRVISGKLA